MASLALSMVLARALAIWVAMWTDRAWGEPPAWAHPVVAMGRYLGWLGPALTRLPAGAAFAGGALAWLGGAGVVAVLAWGMEAMPGAAIGGGAAAIVLHAVALGLMLKPLLAWRMLHDEVSAVEQALAVSLAEGQRRLQRLVSRDVTVLNEAAVRESAIESLAENLNDSLVAPLFWFAVGGLPAAAVYRFANTADAMWGYRGRWEWAGKWAARADDVLSWLPARLTALLLCGAARVWPGGRRMRDEARRTPSPNGGWPMGTMALLLEVSLRKPGVYALHASARPPVAHDTAKALRWAGGAAWLAALVCTLAGTLIAMMMTPSSGGTA